MDVFDLVATLKLDTEPYEKALQDIESGKTTSSKTLSSRIGDSTEKTKNLNSALSTAAKVGGAAFAAVGGAAIAFGKKAVAVGGQFDASMSQVAATMGFSVDELSDSSSKASQDLEKLRSFAQQMGRTTAFSATQAADALNYMALAGYDVETSMQMLPTVLNLAAAGGMDLARASDMVTDAQTALGLDLSQTSTMVDQMAKTASTTNTSVAQLGDAFLTVGGNAKTMYGGTAELSSVIGILADNGIKASEAGTHLRNILLALTPSSDDAAEAWEEIGVKAYDAQGKVRPFKDIFLEFSDAVKDMSDQKRTNLISSMFNKTDLASVNALLSTTRKRWEQVDTAISEAQGSAEKMAGTQLGNVTGQATLFRSALEGAYITLSDRLSPMISKVTNLATDALGKATEKLDAYFASEKGQEKLEKIYNALDRVITKIVDNIDPILDTATSLIDGLATAIGWVADNIEMVMTVAGGVLTVWATIKAVGIVKSIIDLGSFIGGLVTKIGTATVGAEAFAGASVALKSILAGLATAALAVGDALLVAYDVKALSEAAGTYSNANDAYLNEINTAFESYEKLYTEKGKAVADQWAGMVYAIDTTSMSLEESQAALKEKIDSYWDDTPKNMWEGFAAGWNDYFGQDGKGLFSLLGDAFDGAVGGVMDMLGIASPSKVFEDIGTNMILGLKNGTSETWSDFSELLKSFAVSIPTFFANIPSQMLNIGSNLLTGLSSGIMSAMGGVIGTIRNVGASIISTASNVLGIHSPSTVFAEIGRFVDEGYAKGVLDNLGTVEDAMDDFADVVQDNDLYNEQEIQTMSTTVASEPNKSMIEVPRYTAPQYLNLTIDLGGQKVKSVIYQMVQEESQRVGLKLVREVS